MQTVSRYKPVGLFMLDDTTPFQDYSPFNRASALTGTHRRHVPMVSGAKYSQSVGGSVTISYTVPVFTQSRERDPFSLAASVVLIRDGATSPVQVISHNNKYDGLSINGSVVSFSTEYLTTGSATCSYDLQLDRAVNLVGVHTATKNSLYVDGELVSEVEITPAQQADQYVATNGNLYSGLTTSANKIGIGGVAVFDHPLTFEAISNINNAANNVLSLDSVAVQFGGNRLSLAQDVANLFLNNSWTTAEDWHAATMRGVAVKQDQLVPQFVGDASIAGQWFDSVSMTTAGVTSVHGVQFDWDGQGVVVEASVDGTTWTPVTRGVNISVIPNGFNPTNKELLIRVSFAGGIVDDTSYLDNLYVVGTKSAGLPTQHGRDITFVNAMPQQQHNWNELHQQWGTELLSSSTVTIGADTSTDPTNFRTIEMWVKRTNSTTLALNGLTSPTWYQDGVAGIGMNMGQWHLVHAVVTNPVTTAVTLTNPGQVGNVTLYEEALTAGRIAEIAAAYNRANALQVGDNSLLSITQSSDAAAVYAHDWTIVGAG